MERRYVLTPLGATDYFRDGSWEFMEGLCETRSEAIDGALRLA